MPIEICLICIPQPTVAACSDRVRPVGQLSGRLQTGTFRCRPARQGLNTSGLLLARLRHFLMLAFDLKLA